MARSVCEELPPFGTIYAGVEVDITEQDDGQLALEVPVPPCRLFGEVEGDALILAGDDCDVAMSGFESDTPFVAHYSDVEGSARWEGDLLELETASELRYTGVPEGFQDWWSAAGTCSGRYSLRLID